MQHTQYQKADSRRVEGTLFTKSCLIFPVLFSGILTSTFAWSIEVTEGPGLTMDPNGVTPLAGVVVLTTDVPTRATLTISDGTGSRVREFAEFRTEHYLPILGLKPDNSYSLQVAVTDQSDESLIMTSLPAAVTAPPPPDFPDIDILVSDPSRMEPGYTLLDKFTRGKPGTPDSYCTCACTGRSVAILLVPAATHRNIQTQDRNLTTQSRESPPRLGVNNTMQLPDLAWHL